jgi:hypothetical protein
VDVPVAAIMYLLNINASYEAPQEPVAADRSFELYQNAAQVLDCYSPNNCTYNGLPPARYDTLYSNDTCSEAIESTMVANITHGQCYRRFDTPNTYFKRFNCLGPNTIVDLVQGCQRAYETILYRTVCLGDDHTTSYCQNN